MSREKFSAEDILLEIYFARKEVARVRPNREDLIGKQIEKDFPDYGRARRDLTRANARARRFCERRAKELASFPIEYGVPDIFFDGDRGVFCCSTCGAEGDIPREIAELEKAAHEFAKKHSHKKEPKK